MDGKKEAKATILEEPKNTSARKKVRRKKRSLLLKLGVVLLMIGITGYGINQQLIIKDGCAGRSSSPVYDKAATLMKHTKVEELKTYVDEISKKRNSSKDINCVYPALYYRMLVGDVKGAKEYHAKVRTLYDTKKGFAPAYKSVVTSMGEVDVQMQRVEDAGKEIEKNRTFSN